jgi:hypothetical protein
MPILHFAVFEVLGVSALERIFKMTVYEISYRNEFKLFNDDSIILYLIYVAVIIEGARETRGGVWFVRGIF